MQKNEPAHLFIGVRFSEVLLWFNKAFLALNNHWTISFPGTLALQVRPKWQLPGDSLHIHVSCFWLSMRNKTLCRVRDSSALPGNCLWCGLSPLKAESNSQMDVLGMHENETDRNVSSECHTAPLNVTFSPGIYCHFARPHIKKKNIAEFTGHQCQINCQITIVVSHHYPYKLPRMIDVHSGARTPHVVVGVSVCVHVDEGSEWCACVCVPMVVYSKFFTPSVCVGVCHNALHTVCTPSSHCCWCT